MPYRERDRERERERDRERERERERQHARGEPGERVLPVLVNSAHPGGVAPPRAPRGPRCQAAARGL